MKINVHIPTQQYGYVEITDLPDDPKEIERLYNKYAEKPIKLATGNVKRIKAFVGGEIDYDEVAHVYTWNGEVYLSGSQYAEQFKKPFDKVAISTAMAKKAGVDAEDIVKMWELKGEASRNFGTSVHQALQLHETYLELSKALQKEYHIHDNFVLKDIVESFYEAHKDEKAHSEILVVDHKTKRAGQIDRLVVTGNKRGFVTDFKTGDVTKNLDIYWKQLEFYSDILRAGGWTIDKPIIYGWNGKWETYRSK
jgi:hypothetical protein